MTPWIKEYRMMLLIRAFDERVEALFGRGVLRGTAHAAIGQEAVAVGVCGALRRTDYVTSTHRGHGHFIAKGGDPRRMMAELFGRATGYSQGRGGSQLMADFRLGFLGANGITGGSMPIATGVALSAKLRRTGRVVVCFFGDGASNQGTFHESLNMAGIWKLPIIYVCENNMYAMSMHVRRSTAVPDIATRAAGYGFPGDIVDGNDVCAIRDVASRAVLRARKGHGPTLIECKTYRLSGHSRGDRRVYRTPDEEARQWKNDPIQRLRRFLRRECSLSADMDKQCRREARAAVREAVLFASRSPFPDLSTIEKGVYA